MKNTEREEKATDRRRDDQAKENGIHCFYKESSISMRVCSNCFAEGIEEEICPFCGMVSSTSLPSITSLKKDKPQSSPIQETTKKSYISNLYIGQHIDGRYTIQRDFGERDGWLFYQAVDHKQGRECILKVHNNPEMQITDIPFLLESSSEIILAPTVIQREPILIVSLPIRTQVFRPVWKMLSEARKLELILELVDAIDLAYEFNLVDIEFYPTKEWLYQVQICSDDAQSTYSLDAQKNDFRRLALFSVEVLCNAFEISELPNNLSPMSVRMSNWTRNMWNGETYGTMKEAQDGLQKVLGNTGVCAYDDIVQAELEIRSIDGVLLINNEIFKKLPSKILLMRGAVFATHRLLRGKILLQSHPLLLTEAGIQPPKVDEVSTWLYFDIVRQEPQIEYLKNSPAKNIQEQIDRARLAMWLNDAKQSQARFGACLQQASSTTEWLEVARFISCDLQGTGDVLKNALKKAKDASSSLNDEYMCAAFYRWRLNDIRTSRRICKRAKKRITGVVELFQWYETQICLFNYDIGQAIIDIFDHKITRTESDLSILTSSILLALDHFDMHENWIVVIKKLEEKIQILPDYELILQLYARMGIRELYFALLEKLDEERHEIARKAAFYRLILKQFDLPYLQEIRKKVHEQEYFEQQIQKLQHDAFEIGLTLTWSKPYSLKVIMEQEIVIAQIQKSRHVYIKERTIEESLEDIPEDIMPTEQSEISQDTTSHEEVKNQQERSITLNMPDGKEISSKQETSKTQLEEEQLDDATQEPSKQQLTREQKISVFAVILFLVAIIIWLVI